MKVIVLRLGGGREKLKDALALLPPAQRKEFETMREARAVQSVFSRLALYKELSRILPVRPEELDLLRTEHGKPYLAAPSPCFGLSHSGECAVLAFDSLPVGVDVEKLSEPPRHLSARLRAKGAAEGRNAFYRDWTACESVLKWQGSGLGELPRLRLFPCGELLGAELAGKELPCRVRSFELPTAQNALVKSGSLEEGYALSLCGETEIAELVFWEIGDVLGSQGVSFPASPSSLRADRRR